MIDILMTVDRFKYIFSQIKRFFCAPKAGQLYPGAKINGELFTGYNDIDIPVSPYKNIFLLDGQCISILFDNTDEKAPGLVIKNDGIYFSTGDEFMPIVQITKNDNGTYTINNNTNNS